MSEGEGQDERKASPPEIGTNDTAAKAVATQIAVDDDDIIRLVEHLVKMINRLGEQTREQIAQGAKLSTARIIAIMNIVSQSTRKIWLADIRALQRYAHDFAEKCPKPEVRRAIFDAARDITRALYGYLELQPWEMPEPALFSRLMLDAEEQVAFNSRHTGVYASIRFARDGQIVIARTTIFAKRAGPVMSRFTTERIGPQSMESLVHGYMYAAENLVFSIGMSEAGFYRSGIFRSVDGGRSGDLVGMRLHMSYYDEGPFAHRLYFHRIGGLDTVASILDAWAPFFSGRRKLDEATLKGLATLVPDIGQILDLMRDPGPDPVPWGLTVPR